MKCMVYAEHEDVDNNIDIECLDEKDMNKYADACRKQGYINVREVIEGSEGVGKTYSI